MSKKRMICTIEGHQYSLPHFEDKSGDEVIQFIQKEPHPKKIGVLVTVNDGTTNESVLEMLIDRMQFLQNAFPCRENVIVITKLQECLFWLDHRTADRNNRNVEGKHEK